MRKKTQIETMKVSRVVKKYEWGYRWILRSVKKELSGLSGNKREGTKREM